MSTKTARGKGKEAKGLVDQRLVKALGHPLRQRILQQIRQEPASPSELADQLGEPLGNVSYHVKILAECQAIELVRTAPVRGAVEHFYRATALPRLDEAEWKQLHPSTRRALFDATLSQIWHDVVEAGRSDGFEDTGTHISWTALELDDQAYAQMVDELDDLIDRALALQADSARRLRKSADNGAEVHSTELALMHFHRAAAGGKRSGRRGKPTKRK
jgi:DNA-binding transcriptional ArsR family regulator